MNLRILTSILVLTLSAGSLAQATTKKKSKATTPAASASQQKTEAAATPEIDVAQDVDALGGNKALMDMATSLDPENRTRIVQQRIVDRHNRFEFGMNYGLVTGGDPYLQTQGLGATVDYHLTPRWSLGARYTNYGNQLSSEGQRVFDDARSRYAAGGSSYVIPDIDYPLQSAMATVDWYPIYGKINLMDWGISQFDIYMLGGAGQIQLSSGWTNMYTAGVGMGFWMNKHWAMRTEFKYQNYQDQIITGSRNIQDYMFNMGVGYIL